MTILIAPSVGAHSNAPERRRRFLMQPIIQSDVVLCLSLQFKAKSCALSPHFTGGEAKISAQVSDPSGVAGVWAEVKKPDGAMVKVTMNLAGEVYQGTIMAGANTRNDGVEETYKVWVRAKDAKGNETPESGEPSDGKEFAVPAPLPPEKPPF